MELMEIRIVKRAQKGDRLAFAELVELYKDKLYNLGYRMLGNPQEAEDIAQEAFLRAYKNLDKYNASHKFSTWIYRIATNLCIDRMRKKKASYSLDAEVDGIEGGDMYTRLSSPDLGPEDEVMRTETQREVQDAIEALPENYRAAVILKYLHDMSLQEIADVLEVPVSTVKTRIHRGREALRAGLRHQSR
ncbi:RNA polymerase sigma factor SigW [Tumebacillus permanentifrigoris]|uniref:RNA polymerase sigma factor n=1 Tax=Tumebacillus permanentifrigoris TaxID=378543 RepID=A0A316DD55_9BACL|nr:RNA polymerase sigma factor SigW [Tumebacillus permanentifrigoris]PWK16157.1 RNA polymerase sigma-70 factor (ECF subfamily) [Tumebacillus permanentifrigoris]